jgi:hypothetical protein
MGTGDKAAEACRDKKQMDLQPHSPKRVQEVVLRNSASFAYHCNVRNLEKLGALTGVVIRAVSYENTNGKYVTEVFKAKTPLKYFSYWVSGC